MAEDRAGQFRKRALDAETKAFKAKTQESRRAWEIVARDWTLMAEKEEARSQIAEVEQLISTAVRKDRQPGE